MHFTNFVQEQRFDHVGVFTYSQEEDTLAASMADQLSEDVKQERYHSLMALQALISEERNAQLEGRELDVLIEGIEDSDQGKIVYGRSYREAPDVDGRVYIENMSAARTGDYCHVKIIQGFTYDLVAERASDQGN